MKLGEKKRALSSRPTLPLSWRNIDHGETEGGREGATRRNGVLREGTRERGGESRSEAERGEWNALCKGHTQIISHFERPA